MIGWHGLMGLVHTCDESGLGNNSWSQADRMMRRETPGAAWLFQNPLTRQLRNIWIAGDAMPHIVSPPLFPGGVGSSYLH